MADSSLDLSDTKLLLALIARSTVGTAIRQAKEVATHKNELLRIAEAKELVVESDARLAVPDRAGAIDLLIQAVRKVLGIANSNFKARIAAQDTGEVAPSSFGNGMCGAVTLGMLLPLSIGIWFMRRRRKW